MQDPKTPRATARTHAPISVSQRGRTRRAQPCGAYGLHAQRYLGLGLLPIPCGGKDGKKPLVKYAGREAPTVQSVTAALRNPGLAASNIGILTGAGTRPITVVDIDDAALVPRVVEALGDTPIRVRTPSGGTHLYYRHQGERLTTLRPHLPIDIKGPGGFVVAPPSIRKPSADHAGGTYRSEAGEMGQLIERLPALPGDWRQRLGRLAGQEALAGPPRRVTRDHRQEGMIPVGVRNNSLFGAGLFIAPTVGSLDELIGRLEDINRLQCEEPLPDAEVRRAAESAWGYQQRGSNWVQSSGVFQIPAEELKLIGSGDALMLLGHLRIAHGSRPEPFAVSVRAMAEHESIPGMGEAALRSAREHLIQRGFLRRVHAGGKGPGDPAKFILTRPTVSVVLDGNTQYKNTSSGPIRERSADGGRVKRLAVVAASTVERTVMDKDTPSSQPAADSTPGIVIPVGGDEPDHLITAKLLASIARPPTSTSDPAWRELVGAFSRMILSQWIQLDPEAASRPQLLVPAHFEMPKERAQELVAEAGQPINVAMGAAHAQMPALVRGVALDAGIKLSTLPRPWRDVRSLKAESERVMYQEAEFAEFLRERDEVPPVRFPGVESAEAPTNFRNRVVKPFRDVLHLAAGLAQVLDDVERQLAVDSKRAGGEDALAGFGAYPDKPRLLLQHVLLIPGLSIAAINRARRLEAGLPHLEAQRPKPEEVVRLRWREANGASAKAA
jgi:hypothetical protein